MNTLDKILMTFINKKNVLIAENLNVNSFRDFQNFRKTFNYREASIAICIVSWGECIVAVLAIHMTVCLSGVWRTILTFGFINKKNVLIAENLNVISFRDFQNFRKTLNYREASIAICIVSWGECIVAVLAIHMTVRLSGVWRTILTFGYEVFGPDIAWEARAPILDL